MPDGIDFVLVDYGIPAFAPAFSGLRDKIALGCMMFIDGGLEGYWETGAGCEFKRQLESDSNFLVSVLLMHKDQLIVLRNG